ncbi:MAG TPA: 4'-phosphopantetheinyl transferase superfamily protein [Pseudomonadota bacterium]|nr:4'-phosphopantetheinyl transferase superfamily protein [Pseudomonadota bacterium]
MEKSEQRPGPAAPPEAAGRPSSLTADWPSLPRRPLPDHEAHLYFMRLDGLAEPPPLLYGLLNPEEQKRCDRYVFMRNRIESTCARALARTALSRYAAVDPRAWSFALSPRGKPSVAGPTGAPPLSFNVSHTEGLVLCLIAREREVGVDGEYLGRRSDIALLSRRCLSAAEQQALWALPAAAQARRFLLHWTLKEAYLKARGIGIGLPLAEITILADDDPQTRAGPPTGFALGPGVADQPDRWQLGRCQPTAQHVAAYAIARTAGEVTVLIEEVTP